MWGAIYKYDKSNNFWFKWSIYTKPDYNIWILILSLYSLSDFTLPASLEKFAEQVKKIYLLHSKDDPVVPFEQVEKYKKVLPNAEIIIFEDKQHFNQESFSEIVGLIKNI